MQPPPQNQRDVSKEFKERERSTITWIVAAYVCIGLLIYYRPDFQNFFAPLFEGSGRRNRSDVLIYLLMAPGFALYYFLYRCPACNKVLYSRKFCRKCGAVLMQRNPMAQQSSATPTIAVDWDAKAKEYSQTWEKTRAPGLLTFLYAFPIYFVILSIFIPRLTRQFPLKNSMFLFIVPSVFYFGALIYFVVKTFKPFKILKQLNKCEACKAHLSVGKKALSPKSIPEFCGTCGFDYRPFQRALEQLIPSKPGS